MQRKKKGFSIELYTKYDTEEYVVYFEEKQYVASTGRKYQKMVVFCYIQDSFTKNTFKGKAVCHKDDIYSLSTGRDVAFHRALEKRDEYYRKMQVRIAKVINDAMKHNVSIERSFNAFNRKN